MNKELNIALKILYINIYAEIYTVKPYHSPFHLIMVNLGEWTVVNLDIKIHDNMNI